MKLGGYASPPSGSFLNKPVLIILAVIISSSSFLLGYMAGKSTVDIDDKEIISIRTVNEEEPAVTEMTDRIKAEDEIVAPPKTSSITDNKEEVLTRTKSRSLQERRDDPVRVKKISAPEPRVFAEVKESSVSGKFTVQAGAFKRMKDATLLESRLSKKGYNSYIETVKSGNVSLYKVRVGAFQSRDDAESTVRSLKKKARIDSFVVTKR